MDSQCQKRGVSRQVHHKDSLGHRLKFFMIPVFVIMGSGHRLSFLDSYVDYHNGVTMHFNKMLCRNHQEANLMNPVIDVIHERKSVRAYEDRLLSREVRDEIIKSAMRAPTAGNMMLYSIIEVSNQAAKNRLVVTCDNQPFIAKAPLVLIFLADYQRWYDYFLVSGVREFCADKGMPMVKPEEGDLLLACCDALIAAQTAVIAAQSLGVGSCYIGDILENYEIHREMFELPQYAVPICMVCFGYPSMEQKERERTERFGEEFIVFRDRYRRLGEDEFTAMYAGMRERMLADSEQPNIGIRMYKRKFSAEYSIEMRRSVRAILNSWAT